MMRVKPQHPPLRVNPNHLGLALRASARSAVLLQHPELLGHGPSLAALCDQDVRHEDAEFTQRELTAVLEQLSIGLTALLIVQATHRAVDVCEERVNGGDGERGPKLVQENPGQFVGHIPVFALGQGVNIVRQNPLPHGFKRPLGRVCAAILEKAELPHMRIHDLRHTCASLLLALGSHPKVVQEVLGHSQISLTLDTYSHLIPGLGEEAAKKIDTILSADPVVVKVVVNQPESAPEAAATA
jgi:hypothetical protein